MFLQGWVPVRECYKKNKKKHCLLSEVVQSPKNTVLCYTPHILPCCLSVTGWEKTPELGLCSNVEVTSMNMLLRTQATWIKSFPNRKKKKPPAPFWYAFSDLISRTTQARSARWLLSQQWPRPQRTAEEHWPLRLTSSQIKFMDTQGQIISASVN